MLPLRLVFDTNTIVSAALKPTSLPRTALVLASAKPARLYVTAAMLEEYGEVLARPELAIRKVLRLQMMELMRQRSHIISPKRRLHVCSDEDDNMFLECADAARADYLVTGNLKHFPAFWKCTKVITAREFVSLSAPHLLPLPPPLRG